VEEVVAMSEADVIYDQAVERLRDATRNRNAALTTAVDDVRQAGAESPEAMDEALDAQTMATYPVVRKMEDAALRALREVAVTCGYEPIGRVIAEADAGWLFEVMLGRALDSVGDEGGNA
jgi:hypothetical protein